MNYNDSYYTNSSEKLSTNAGVKNSKRSKIKDWTVLFDPLMGTLQELTLRVKVDLEVKAGKEYSTLNKNPGLEPQHQIV